MLITGIYKFIYVIIYTCTPIISLKNFALFIHILECFKMTFVDDILHNSSIISRVARSVSEFTATIKAMAV
jgi:hypothetical protein